MLLSLSKKAELPKRRIRFADENRAPVAEPSESLSDEVDVSNKRLFRAGFAGFMAGVIGVSAMIILFS